MKPWQRKTRINEIHAIALAQILGGTADIDVPKYYVELNGLKQPRPGTPWIEAAVMLCVIARMRAPRARGLLRRLRQRHEEAGTPELFEAFEQKITTYLHPAKLTGHGYGETFDDLDHADVWSHVGGLVARLEAMGHALFLNSGTLLGVVRDGRLIGHDDDIDLAVRLEARTPEDAAHEWLALRTELEQIDVYDPARETVPGLHKLTSKGNVEIDLFPLWFDTEDRAFLYPHTFGELHRDDIFPLASCGATGLNIPAEPEKMLAINYGPDWPVPDPHFRFDWPGQRKKFAAFLAALKQAAPAARKAKETT